MLRPSRSRCVALKDADQHLLLVVLQCACTRVVPRTQSRKCKQHAPSTIVIKEQMTSTLKIGARTPARRMPAELVLLDISDAGAFPDA